MPRGLGEDPLSRQRKRSVRTHQPAEGPSSLPGGAQFALPGAKGGISHNDVFFKKRSEAASLATSPVGIGGSAERAPAVSVAVQESPETPAVQAFLPNPVVAHASETQSVVPPAAPATTQVVAVHDTPPVAAAPELAPVKSEPAIPDVRPAQAKDKEGGLLKGLFRRFRK